MEASLDAVMKQHSIGDAELGASCAPSISRTLIWCYRKRKKTPGAAKAQSIIEALAARGIALTLAGLLAGPGKKRPKKAA